MYEAPQGVTRQQAHKQKLANIERSSTYLREVVELLRNGSETDAAAALSRIRQAGNVDDAVNVLALARAQVATNPSTFEASAGSPVQLHRDTSTPLPRTLSQRSLDSLYVVTLLQMKIKAHAIQS